MTSIEEPVCVVPAGDHCGEGPVWDAANNALYWTDINRFLIHRFDEARKEVKFWFFDEPVTALSLTNRNDTLAVALGSRLLLWEPASDKRVEHGFRLERWPTVRLNDGRADPRGSLWLGSMRNNVNPDGSASQAGGTDGILVRIDPNGTVSEWKHHIGISNTVAWSPDHSQFYFADSLDNRIWSYDYDMATGAISVESTLLHAFNRGLPDGSAVDSEGYLWNCRYGGKCILRLSPEGAVDQVIEMPVSNITSCTFGGPDLRTLYVTTAANGAPEGERLAGGLFSFRTGVMGQPENRFQAFS